MKKLLILMMGMACTATTYAQFYTITEGTANTSNTANTLRLITEERSPESRASEVDIDTETAGENKEGENLWVQRYLSVSYPLDKIEVTSPYGTRRDPMTGKGAQHQGLDLRAHYVPVYAMMPGKVVKVGYENRGGNYLKIQSGDYTVTYCHLSRTMVPEGMMVAAGAVVAVSGNSGKHTTAPHLHVGVKYHGKAINPQVLLDFVRQTREEVLQQITSHYASCAPPSPHTRCPS
jgi:murein DD-endopeptidase